MTKKYKSDVFASIHETASDMFESGAIDKKTMRKFDATCLTPVSPLSAEEIRKLREREGVSQSVFAHHLNVSVGIVSKWERGEKKPSGSTLRLLQIVAAKGVEVLYL